MSDFSEEYQRPRKQKMAVEEERRAHTHLEHHPSPNDVPILKTNRKLRQEGVKNLKGSKISAKIKERRKSEYEIEIADPEEMYDLQQNLREAEKYVHYHTEDTYQIPTSYTPDLREGKPYNLTP